MPSGGDRGELYFPDLVPTSGRSASIVMIMVMVEMMIMIIHRPALNQNNSFLSSCSATPCVCVCVCVCVCAAAQWCARTFQVRLRRTGALIYVVRVVRQQRTGARRCMRLGSFRRL
jgi:hypothetical protein